MIPLRRRLACLALLLPAACSAPDYTPVRGWAENASLAVSYPTAAVSLRVLPAPEAPPPPPLPRRGPAPPPPPPPPIQLERAADDAVLAMQEALSIWFVALATLAGDGLLPYRESPMPEIAARIRPADAGAAESVTALGAQLRHASRDIYRAPEMRGAMFEADPLVQRILTGLAQSVARRPEAESAAAQTRDAADLAAARAYYQALLREVSEGHGMLARRAGRITGDEALADIRRAEDALRRAMAELPRGLGLPPPPPGAPPSHPPARRGWFW